LSYQRLELTFMSARKKIIIRLTDEQQEQIRIALGKEVTHVMFQLIAGSHLIVDISDAPDTTEDKL
jgi:hypothetical protein